MRVILITGGTGFIGSNFIKYFIRRNKDFVVINMDNLGPMSNLNNLKELERSPRYHFVNGSICNQELVNYVIKRHRPDIIINFAAETNVNKSLANPMIFSQTNILGTLTLLESARYFWGKNNFKGKRFIQLSTSQVYGSTYKEDDFFTEESPISPQNPYAASKASADLVVKSFYDSYGFPAIIARCCQNYGPFQNTEEFIPSCIINILNNRDISTKPDVLTKKEWIHVLDNCVGLIRIIFYGKTGEIYNIGSGYELSNYEIAQELLKLSGKTYDTVKPESNIRCGLNSYKLKNNLKWGVKYPIAEGLIDTIHWYKSAFLNKNI
ncbi:GDP-mannose 4,6-dehydratase [Herbivorax sp. ANBcel31]|uniref:dTDP-glucose 4,6-dehydratase n=1 Tax=Herbivorax sp. ANBcel31 TaxID=3069754 RepID=UPI0027B64EC8|nr:GDP-mannose 4,6-dehydratase [Herbivorax sp. ANBcel31]MDQ2085969.1 GDP-mannose 4,6-dehydratase [Herbivorax sp. ANBcel31]